MFVLRRKKSRFLSGEPRWELEIRTLGENVAGELAGHWTGGRQRNRWWRAGGQRAGCHRAGRQASWWTRDLVGGAQQAGGQASQRAHRVGWRAWVGGGAGERAGRPAWAQVGLLCSQGACGLARGLAAGGGRAGCRAGA